MLTAVFSALNNLFAPEFRTVLLKSIGLSLLLLLALWGLLQSIVGYFASDLTPWIDTTISIVTGLGMMVGFVFLIGPVSTLVAGLFLDDIAAIVERTDYPADRPGVEQPLNVAIVQSIKFFGIVALANMGALLLLLVPGVNLIAFFVVNGYLLGREFFELAAQRHHTLPVVAELRHAHFGRLFMGGLAIAGFMAIPLLNLATPLFATALMVHLHKRIARRLPADHDQSVLPSKRQ